MIEKKLADVLKPERKDVSSAEMQIALSGPAVSANKFYIITGPTGIRIAFAEQFGEEPPSFRTAVVLSPPDAYSLSVILGKMLDEAIIVEEVTSPDASGAAENG